MRGTKSQTGGAELAEALCSELGGAQVMNGMKASAGQGGVKLAMGSAKLAEAQCTELGSVQGEWKNKQEHTKVLRSMMHRKWMEF